MAHKKPSGPALTIIVATLNVSNVIAKCLQSIADQDYTDYELIIADGVSTDGSIEIINRYKSIITYFESARDGGIYAAWNKALKHAQGAWVMFLGADDYFPDDPGTLRKLMAFAQSRDVDFIAVRNTYVDSRGKPLRTVGEPWRWRQFKRYMSVCHVGALHRKTYFDTHGTFDTDYKIAGDYELLMRAGPSLRAADFGEVIAYCGSEGVSRSRIARAFYEAIKLQKVHGSSTLTASVIRYGLGYCSLYLRRAVREMAARFKSAD